jgi:NAD(P)-dependent dehydrogenase (short-subunit alcohol dehydrogenase family)
VRARAVVTGASRGIGEEVARQLAALGLEVVGTGRRAEDVVLDAVVPLALDVTDDASVHAAAEAVAAMGGADVLVNNAGITGRAGTPVLEADLDDVRRTLETNLLGTWRVTQAFAPQLRAGGHGRVVNVSTRMASLSEASTGSGGYRTSKVALNMLTVTLANELRADGVLVNSVCPGRVRTDMGGASAPRSVQEGAAGVVWAATLPDDGPTGGFFRDGEPIAW